MTNHKPAVYDQKHRPERGAMFLVNQARRAKKDFTMGSMSRRKGAAGEREAAAALNEVLGTHLHRGRQYHGGPDSPDLAGDMPGLHIEVKRVERLSLYPAMYQARRDAAPDQVPVVMHRANNRPWLIVVEVVDLIRLLDVVDERRAKIGDRSDGEVVGQSGNAAVAMTITNDGGRV